MRVDPTATACPHRGPGSNVAVIGQRLDPADDAANIAWGKETFAGLQPHLWPAPHKRLRQ